MNDDQPPFYVALTDRTIYEYLRIIVGLETV